MDAAPVVVVASEPSPQQAAVVNLAEAVRKLSDRLHNLETARALEAIAESRMCTRISNRAARMVLAAQECGKRKTS